MTLAELERLNSIAKDMADLEKVISHIKNLTGLGVLTIVGDRIIGQIDVPGHRSGKYKELILAELEYQYVELKVKLDNTVVHFA